MMFPIDYNGDVLNHNARVGVDGGIVESTDFLADFSEQTKRVNMPLLLDIYPNAAAAYSLRKLRTAYTGSAIRVRRSSDNTETDIGFNNAGDLDTSALATFVGNGNGFVSTWYDQSGNNRNATQTTQADQPQIVRNGLILTVNSKPCIYPLAIAGMNMGFNDSNLGTVNKHIFVVADTTRGENNTVNYQSVLVASYSGSGSVGNDFSFSYYHGEPTIRLRNYDGSSFVLNSGTTSGYKLWQNIRTSSLLYIADNNNPYTVGGTPNTVYNSNTYRIGGHVSAGVNNSPKLVQEVIYYPSNQSTNRIGIETNINSYYRIYQQEALLLDYYPDAAAAYSLRKLRSGYTGAAIQVRRSSDSAVQNIGFDSNGGLDTTALTTFVGTGNTGFVTTWYDQSGNGNNATSTGTTQQPVIFSGGTIISENNKPSLRFDGVNTYLNSNNVASYFTGVDKFLTASTVLKGNQLTPISNQAAWGFSNSSTDTPIRWFGQSSGTTQIRLDERDDLGVLTNIIGGDLSKNSLGFLISNADSKNLFSNSVNVDSDTGTLNQITLNKFSIGCLDRTSRIIFLNGQIQEIILWASNQSTNRPLIEANINSYYNIYPSDSDANAFVTAAALTGTTQIQAVNKLVTDLKGYGLWGKMRAIYPFVGGTAASHKFNLKDPRDVDGAFRLVFSGGWTHSATGALPNGSTGYADTRLNPNAVLQLNAVHLSVYNRSNLRLSGIIGSSDVSLTNALYLYPRYTNDREFTRMFSNSGPGSESLNSQGFWVSSRVSSTGWKVFRNNFLQSSYTVTSSNKTSFNTYIGAGNLNGTPEYGVGEFAFATIGDGLTDTEAANLYTAVQTFQTTLGRQV